MSKIKIAFFCQNCGYESPKWLGKCPACQTWNSFVEEVAQTAEKGKVQWADKESSGKGKPVKLNETEDRSETKILLGDNELNRVLGGGLVHGSVVLLGGEPGIGKSTLLLQACLTVKGITPLYISGEESIQQIKMRASRMKGDHDTPFFLTEVNMQSIETHLKKLQPGMVVFDSIQTLNSSVIDAAPGSVSQLRQTTSEIIRFAKETNTPVFLVGHITKDGAIAGPKVLEHMVDAVLQFEGDRHMSYRIIRTSKNRFGSTSELGIYEMTQEGLREITNPSEILITQRSDDLSGVSIGAMLEGNRPLLIETQALVSPATYGNPQRTPTGFDVKRLNMLLAVLERRCGFRLGTQDVFLNMAGGIKVTDPAVDLAVCMAIISSLQDISISGKITFAGEVGLGGEIRAVNKIENRISEAEKLGFNEICISSYNKLPESSKRKIKVTTFSKLQDLVSYLF